MGRFVYMFLYMCVSMCLLCIQVHICVPLHMAGGKRQTLGIIYQSMSTLIYETDSQARLAGQQAQGSFCLLLQIRRCYPRLPPQMHTLVTIGSSVPPWHQVRVSYYPGGVGTLAGQEGTVQEFCWELHECLKAK